MPKRETESSYAVKVTETLTRSCDFVQRQDDYLAADGGRMSMIEVRGCAKIMWRPKYIRAWWRCHN